MTMHSKDHHRYQFDTAWHQHRAEDELLPSYQPKIHNNY